MAIDSVVDFLAREQNDLATLELTNNSLNEQDSVGVTNPAISDIDMYYLEENETNPENMIPKLDFQNITMPIIEPEKVFIWREEQQNILKEKDLCEAEHIENWRTIAKKELDSWYKNRKDQLDKIKSANRITEDELIAETENGTKWEKITKLCEFNSKKTHNTKDVSYMRSMLLLLKTDELKDLPYLPK